MSIRAAVMRLMLRLTVKKQFDNFDDVPAFRERMANSARLTPKVPDDIRVVAVTVSGVPCEWISAPDSNEDRVLVYFHGGGYVFGNLDSHRDIGWRLARAARMRVLMVDYRLAPEHPFPAALEDATDCYRWLLDEGFAPENIAIGGDSAGGGLSVALLINLRNLGLPLPSSCVLLSPWTDLSMSGDSIAKNAPLDPMLSGEILEKMANYYLGKRDRKAPLASPLFGDLSGLPAVFIQVGSLEVLRSDAERLADRIREEGGEVLLEVWPGMFHVFQVFAARVPEGRRAIETLGEFLLTKTGASHD